MRVIMVMFDSLNRRMLPNYGCNWTHTPNFKKLGENTVAFDNSYVGSMPCMPARRELHTGRCNFLHRSWGPLEPFDDSMPEILKTNGIHTHLSTDHYHYFEDGGATYHTRYRTYENFRGEEGDSWKGVVDDQHTDNVNNGRFDSQDKINRMYMDTESKQSQTLTFDAGIEFMQTNKDKQNWFLHIESFDPHEPFFTHEQYKELYKHEYDGKAMDWPPYEKVTQDEQTVNHVKMEYAALLSMCDKSLGRVIDLMNEHDMWKDTMLIVNTDHGFMLGEHGHWAKCYFPFYDEIAHTPLFIWDPRYGKKDCHVQSLVQTIDIPATILEFFSIPLPKDMQGKPLNQVITEDKPVRTASIFGIHGGQITCTDGRYVYMRSPVKDNRPLYQYTLMPTRHGGRRAFINTDELKTAQMTTPFSFTKEIPVMKIATLTDVNQQHKYATMLFDLVKDPLQENPIDDKSIETYMCGLMVSLMKENDCPIEQFERMGFTI